MTELIKAHDKKLEKAVENMARETKKGNFMELMPDNLTATEKEAFLEYLEFYSDFLPLPNKPISVSCLKDFKKALTNREEPTAARLMLYYFLTAMPPKTASKIIKHLEENNIVEIKDKNGNLVNIEFAETKESFIDTLAEETAKAITYEALPTAPTLYFFNELMTANGKQRQLKTTAGNRKIQDRHKSIEYKPEKEGFTVTQKEERNGNTISITIDNSDKITGKGVKKCYAFLLAQCNKQNFKPVIGFSLQEIVDRGMYSNLSNARAGIKAALDTLQKIKFSGTIKKGKKTIVQAEAGILFYHYKIKNNYVEVSVNENFNIEFVAAYFAMIPLFAYSLDNTNAFDITQYIFTLARQNTTTIKKNGKFTISFKAIQSLLALPTETDIDPDKKFKPKQYIIDPILKAIADIEAAAKNANNEDFKIDAIYNTNYKNYKEFLEGYIEISFTGNIFDKLCEIADKQEARIEAAKNRRAKRLEESNKKG